VDVDPKVGGVPPLARIVDEGLLIALSAVRMAVKNDIIVSGLAEHADYDPARFAATARRQLRHLAEENQESAERVRRQRKSLTAKTWRVEFSQDQLQDIAQLKLRRRIHRRLATALSTAADDDDRVHEIVRDAQVAASDEVRRALRIRLIKLAIDPRDPDYQSRKAERTEMFVAIDLALLRIRADEAADDSEGY
jgi:hypothetical protein